MFAWNCLRFVFIEPTDINGSDYISKHLPFYIYNTHCYTFGSVRKYKIVWGNIFSSSCYYTYYYSCYGSIDIKWCRYYVCSYKMRPKIILFMDLLLLTLNTYCLCYRDINKKWYKYKSGIAVADIRIQYGLLNRILYIYKVQYNLQFIIFRDVPRSR